MIGPFRLPDKAFVQAHSRLQTPGRNRRLAFENLDDPQARAQGRTCRQRCGGKEAAGHDLAVGFGHPVLRKMPDDEDGDVIPARHVAVEEHAVQFGGAGKLDPSLLDKFALERVQDSLADFDATAGKMPAGDITMLDQKYLVVGIEYDGADAERHAAGKSPVEMKKAP